jgi:hypothetical protein
MWPPLSTLIFLCAALSTKHTSPSLVLGIAQSLLEGPAM